MRLLSSLVLILVLAVPLTARAQSPVVVELYTSQGCSSCPPADVFLGKLKDRDDLIVLSLHVDYWDYLGWKDKFGSPQNTSRQRSYARARGSRSIYTPQIVVQGVGQGVGSHRSEVNDLIDASAKTTSNVKIEARRVQGKVEIRLSADARETVRCVIQLVEYSPLERVTIKRGENSGKTLDYHNVVRHWNEVGTWNGRGDAVFLVDSKSDLPAVIIVQALDSGPILAAVKVN